MYTGTRNFNVNMKHNFNIINIGVYKWYIYMYKKTSKCVFLQNIIDARKDIKYTPRSVSRFC